AHAGLDLVGEEERARGVAELARGGEELPADRADAPFALYRLDADAADLVRELRAQIGSVVEPNELNVRHNGRERLAVLLFVCRRDGAHGSAVKALLDGEEPGADLLALGPQYPGVSAGQLQSCLPGFGARVAEEDAVEPADLREAQSELCCVLVIEEVGGVEEAFGLAGERCLDRRVCIAQR